MFLDSVLYKTLAISFNILILSILFFLTSIFGLFIGPALIAVIYTFSKLEATKYLKNLKTYFTAFKKNFFRGIILEIYILVTFRFLQLAVKYIGDDAAGMFIKFIIMSFMIGFILNYAAVLGKVKNNLQKRLNLTL